MKFNHFILSTFLFSFSSYASACYLNPTLELTSKVIKVELSEQSNASQMNDNFLDQLPKSLVEKKSCEDIYAASKASQLKLDFEGMDLPIEFLKVTTCRNDQIEVRFTGMLNFNEEPDQIDIRFSNQDSYLSAKRNEIKINRPKNAEYKSYFVAKGKFIVKVKEGISEEGEEINAAELSITGKDKYQLECMK